MRRRILTVAAVALLALAADARAQVLVGAAVGQANQAKGQSDSPYLGPGFGGTSLAGLGAIDVAIGPRTTVGAEVSLAGDISGTQSERVAGGSAGVVTDHHDTVFSVVVKTGTPLDERVRVSGVLGGGLAQRHTERNGTFGSLAQPSNTGPVHDAFSNFVWAFTGGIDLSIGLTNHVALLAVGRLHQLKDDDRRTDGVVNRGVSSTIVRFGGGLQIRF